MFGSVLSGAELYFSDGFRRDFDDEWPVRRRAAGCRKLGNPGKAWRDPLGKGRGGEQVVAPRVDIPPAVPVRPHVAIRIHRAQVYEVLWMPDDFLHGCGLADVVQGTDD